MKKILFILFLLPLICMADGRDSTSPVSSSNGKIVSSKTNLPDSITVLDTTYGIVGSAADIVRLEQWISFYSRSDAGNKETDRQLKDIADRIRIVNIQKKRVAINISGN